MKHIILNTALRTYADGLDLICKKLPCSYTIADAMDLAAINLVTPEIALTDPDFATFAAGKLEAVRWNAIYKTAAGGYIICGDRKIDVIHALLKVLDRYEDALQEINISRFNRLFQNFDDFSGAFTRAADDFDLEVHIIDIARSGAESFEINTLYDDIPVQIRERLHKTDVYPWWCSYCPGLDMFYASRLFRGVHRESMLENNRKVLLNNARLARALGLAPTFTTFEMRLIPDRFFLHYPELRGARVDYDPYSNAPEYCLDPTHPMVQEHFAEMLTMLLQDVPDLDMYEIWTNDSNAGFPWSNALYMRANGPLRIYMKPLHEIINPFLTALQEAARKCNSKTRIHLNTDWSYTEDEKQALIENLPEGVSVTIGYHTFTCMKAEGNTALSNRIAELGQEPVQCISEGVAHAWKLYGPLVGMPFPRTTLKLLKEMHSFGVENVTLRGGICSRAFVPDYINNEIVREFKYRDIEDIDDFLMTHARRFAANEQEAQLLWDVWQMCDEFHSRYQALRDQARLSWTTSLFVSPRTLFRKLVRPVVPNVPCLTFNETRYYKPFAFFSFETDPSWDDMSYFNFVQVDTDEQLQIGYTGVENSLLPVLNAILEKINAYGALESDYIRDLRDRIEAMLCILTNERAQMKVQQLTHAYDAETDAEKKQQIRAIIRQEVAEEIENTKRFIRLLDTTPSVLIPTTSGEETVYMYKAPMSQPLKRRVIVMQNHMDDEPKGVDYALYRNNSKAFLRRG